MKNFAIITVFCMASLAPAFAAEHEMDIAAITCAEYDEMEDADKMAVAEALVAEMDSAQDAESAMIEIDTACTGGSSDTTVLTAMTAGATE